MLNTDIDLENFTIVKRNGMVVPFRKERILRALEAAFRDTKKVPFQTELPGELGDAIADVAAAVFEEMASLAKKGSALTVEGTQDLVEITLMRRGYHDVARDYIIYRDHQKAKREAFVPHLKIRRSESGFLAKFNPLKLAASLEEAFVKTQNPLWSTNEEKMELLNRVVQAVVAKITAHAENASTLESALVQKWMEEELMLAGYIDAARALIHSHALKSSKENNLSPSHYEGSKSVIVKTADGGERPIFEHEIRRRIQHACRGYESLFSIDDFVANVFAHFYEGMVEHEIDSAMIMASRVRIELEPAFNYITARLLLDVIYREALECSSLDDEVEKRYRQGFASYIRRGVGYERLSAELLDFDLEKLGSSLEISRDLNFQYLGLQTLYDRYFIHHEKRRLETPQYFWMRVSMGLAIREKDKTEKALEFYNLLSQFDYTCATPTLFNSGTRHQQLSSCYLSTIADDLSHIFKVVGDNAQLSKWAGGIGNDWSYVRATGAHIKGTNGESQGVIPFMKVANDTAVAVNQGGKRKGASVAYLETWHLDIEDFLELRKNTGDERRRTHDMNTANWIPDLFMKRVLEGGSWTLFSPNDVPDLHDLYGKAFEERYTFYEKAAEEKKIKLSKKVEAIALWRKMLSMLFETGHPWITFKDPSNIRSPQDHVGVVHCSNLCTEILLNTSPAETAVCNLGSINLGRHIRDGKIDKEKLEKTVSTAIRMLDNVVDINFYPTAEAEKSNKRHRPIGMGVMGFQDALWKLGISFASHEAVNFSDEISELISFFAIKSSSLLAKERGTYESYKGSKWDRGLLPQDTLALLASERGGYLEVDTSSKLDWSEVRELVAKYGMRNSNTMAIAPTATIANIIGVMPCIEPPYKNLYVKSNLSGEFTVVNEELVNRLKALSLWDADMLEDLKYYDGSILEIDRIPKELAPLFLTAFEIAPEWLIECASRRQKWIDMGMSLNLYLSEPSGKKMHDMYVLAFIRGLKTTYYLRTLGATQIEKSTVDINKRGLQPRWMKNASASSRVIVEREAPKACPLDGSCESCQ